MKHSWLMQQPPLALLGAVLALSFGFTGSGQETQRQYLSGRGKDDAIPWQFLCTAGAKSGQWTTIPVPSNWEMHGFGTLNYFRDDLKKPVEQGQYKHTFTAPAHWSNQRVQLVFDGVMTDTRVTVNGQPVGPLHQGSFYRFRYDVTRLLKFGQENLLEVTVDKLSANESVNRAERQGDYWLFGGIFRPVFLEARPPQGIDRVAIDARADGAFAVDVFTSGLDGADTIEAQILDLSGKALGAAFTQKIAGEKTTLRTQAVAPRQWTAETPQLYRVEVRLKQGDKTLHHVQQRFGFRTMEVRPGDGLYVNGQRVILKGCCRHSFWPESGRCLNETIHRADINLIKDMNMNAVRMSHYPPDEAFLDLCDELGLYVLDELGGWQKSYDAVVGRKLVEEMIVRDVNHPAILFWDNGNEGGWNRSLDGEFAQWDPQQRNVLHPWATFSDVNTAHYRIYEATKTICASNVIYMPTEFLHGLYDGGIGAGMEDYWKLMQSSKALGGGFFWALVDEGVKRPDTGKIDVAGNQAPDGIVGPYREKEASFYTIKELWSPIGVVERLLPEKFTGALTLENHFSFTDARQCAFTWQLRKFHRPNETASGFTVIAEGAAPSPAIPPGGQGSLQLPLPANWKQADALSLRASDPTGRELWTWVWPLPAVNDFRAMLKSRSSQRVTARETAAAIVVKAGDLTVQFAKDSGQLVAVQRGPQKYSLANGPRLASGNARLASLQHQADRTGQVITATFEGDLKSVVWRVSGNGWAQCDYVYTAEGPRDYLGVTFDYPELQVKRKKWLGDGPYRVWKNRLRGGTLSVWENDYNNTVTGWSGWVYPEFKGCFAGVRWLQLETTEGLITAIPERENLWVQVLTPEFPPKNLQAKTAVTLPTAGLAFLHAIPPIGNKFHAARETGPQGQPSPASGEYRGSVSFHFGPLP